MKFQALGLPEKLCAALEQNGITEPTAVQNGAIPVVLAGRDLLSSAKTGSGKTLAYSLPVITRLQDDKNATALVLVPTREIGVQVQQVMQPYLRALGLPPAALIIGGVSFGPQIAALKRRPPVIIATPGRLNDHFTNSHGKFRLEHLKFLVLDEADRMLDMGFLPQVKQILRHIPSERQTLLFSATMPSDLARACKEMLNEPERVAVDAPNTANTDIEQRMLEVDMKGKQDALVEALNEVTESALVFARTKRRTDRVAQFLEEYGVRAERIHGDRSQAQRQKAIEQFRSGKVKVLVATDIAARGLDIPLVELVINFDLPEMKEDYVHRIGRTGRAGAQGVALSFVTPEERGHWASITGQKRGNQGHQRRGEGRTSNGYQKKGFDRPARPTHSARPFGRNEQPETEPRIEVSREDVGQSWSKPLKKSWGERPRRDDNRFERRDFQPRSNGGERFERPAQRPSRFQRWGQPRTERQEERPHNPKHIFTGREGDEQRRPQGKGRFERRDGERKPRFGGHGRSAPPAQGQQRGRWSKRPNAHQPRD